LAQKKSIVIKRSRWTKLRICLCCLGLRGTTSSTTKFPSYSRLTDYDDHHPDGSIANDGSTNDGSADVGSADVGSANDDAAARHGHTNVDATRHATARYDANATRHDANAADATNATTATTICTTTRP